jgi:quercetin dioxygenase-like cupin family protein
MESWRLGEIETPGGSRSPVVLKSDDEARAVLVSLEPGQALGDHQVKEHAWILVVEGSVTFRAGAEELEAPAGTLARFEPDERRSVRASHGAKLLLLLAPWPGPGHYRGQDKAHTAGLR